MSPLTCHEVEAQLDLYAVGEGDAVERAAIRQHLTRCPTCTRSYQEAQQLAGLLGLHFQEPDRLRRLHARLDAEEKRPLRRFRVPAGPRWAAALAALVLLTVGLQFLAGPAGHNGRPAVAVTAAPRLLPPGPGSKELAFAPFRAGGPEKKRLVQPLGAIILWASPRADWSIVSERRIDLQAGELWWKVASPAVVAGQPLPPFEVTTPAGTVKAREAQFAVAVRTDEKREQAAVIVKTFTGTVELTSASSHH